MANKLSWWKRLYRTPDLVFEDLLEDEDGKYHYIEDVVPQYRWWYCFIMNIIDIRCWYIVNRLFRGRCYDYPFGLCYTVGWNKEK